MPQTGIEGRPRLARGTREFARLEQRSHSAQPVTTRWGEFEDRVLTRHGA
jgi:hypothetical protein